MVPLVFHNCRSIISEENIEPLINENYENESVLSEDKVPSKCCHLLFKQNSSDPCSLLSNEIPCLLVAQGSAKLQELKVEDQR